MQTSLLIPVTKRTPNLARETQILVNWTTGAERFFYKDIENNVFIENKHPDRIHVEVYIVMFQ